MTTENVVQATSRDILGEALLRLRAAKFPLVLQVHDEAVAEGRERDLPEFKRIMEVRPEWCKPLPLVVDAFYAERYRK